jgi:hypothetical protein
MGIACRNLRDAQQSGRHVQLPMGIIAPAEHVSLRGYRRNVTKSAVDLRVRQ